MNVCSAEPIVLSAPGMPLFADVPEKRLDETHFFNPAQGSVADHVRVVAAVTCTTEDAIMKLDVFVNIQDREAANYLIQLRCQC